MSFFASLPRGAVACSMFNGPMYWCLGETRAIICIIHLIGKCSPCTLKVLVDSSVLSESQISLLKARATDGRIPFERKSYRGGI